MKTIDKNGGNIYARSSKPQVLGLKFLFSILG